MTSPNLTPGSPGSWRKPWAVVWPCVEPRVWIWWHKGTGIGGDAHLSTSGNMDGEAAAVRYELQHSGSHVQVDPSWTWLLADSTECFPLICLCSEPGSPASGWFSELPDNLWITVSLLQSAQAHGHNLQLRSLKDIVILKQLPLDKSDQVPGTGLWIISMLSHLFSLLYWQEITLISLFAIRKLLSGGNGIWHQVPIIWKHIQLTFRIYLSPIPCYIDL